MNVLLTHGYFIAEDPAEARIMKPYPPLGLLCLSAWLAMEGIPNKVYDTTFSSLEGLKYDLLDEKPAIIGIYSTLMTKLNVLKIISFIKGSPAFQHSVIIIGGPDARHNAASYLEHGVDLVIPGEGEQPLTETINMLDNKKSDLAVIPGIIFRKTDGEIVNTGDAKPLDPRLLPLPNRESIDMSAYTDHWQKAHGYSSLNINTMRGCPNSCNWCSRSVFGSTYRRRDPESVVEEIIKLRDLYKPDQVWFTDDVFTISLEWLKNFINELSRRNVVLQYECISRSDRLDDEVLDLLAKSGCRKLWIGCESGSQKVIDLMNRRMNIEWTIDVIRQAKKKEISTGTFIMLGYPGEEKKDILETAKFLKRASPDELTVGIAYPIKGTPFYDLAKPGFIRPFDWEKISERDIVFKKAYTNLFYRFAIRYLFNISRSLNEKDGFKRSICKVKTFITRVFIALLH